MLLSSLREAIRGVDEQESKEHEHMNKAEIVRLLTPIKKALIGKEKTEEAFAIDKIIVQDEFDGEYGTFDYTQNTLRESQEYMGLEKLKRIKHAFEGLPVYCASCENVNDELLCEWEETIRQTCRGRANVNALEFLRGETIYNANQVDSTDEQDSDTDEFTSKCPDCDEYYSPDDGNWYIAINTETAKMFVKELNALKGIKEKTPPKERRKIENQFTKVNQRANLEFAKYDSGIGEEQVGLPIEESMEKTL